MLPVPTDYIYTHSKYTRSNIRLICSCWELFSSLCTGHRYEARAHLLILLYRRQRRSMSICDNDSIISLQLGFVQTNIQKYCINSSLIHFTEIIVLTQAPATVQANSLNVVQSDVITMPSNSSVLMQKKTASFM